MNPHTLFGALLLLLVQGLAHSIPRHPGKYLIHQYPDDTWIENLAVRSNGLILATQASNPHLYSVNPFTGASTLVYTFPHAISCTGITETLPDVFYVAVGNASLADDTGVTGSFSIWNVDYSDESSPTPKVSKHFNVPEAQALDGLITLNATRGLLLAADLNKGHVLRLNVLKKTSEVAIHIPLMKPGPNNVVGVDGIKIHNGFLYWTDPGQYLIAKAPMDENGYVTGKASVVQPIQGDDFIFDAKGDIFTVGPGGNLTKIYGPGLANMRNLTSLPGPTAAQFGRAANDSGCLYITTSGGDSNYSTNPVTVAGAIYGVDVFRNGSCPPMN